MLDIISLRRTTVILHVLLFLIVASSALTYWPVASYALNGHWHPEYYKLSSYISLVPFWQKTLKDLFALCLLIGSLSFASTRRKDDFWVPDLNISYVLCFAVLGLAIARSVTSELGLSTILMSLRPIVFTVSILVFCHRHLNLSYLRAVLEATNIVAVIQVIYALLQRQSAFANNGVSWLSRGIIRSVGTFTEPNSMALFLALIFYVNLYILPWNKGRYILLLACSIGIFLTDSRAALAVICLLIIEKLVLAMSHSSSSRGSQPLVLILLLFLPVFTFLVMQQINATTARGANSLTYGGRLEIIQGYLGEVGIVALSFGQYLGFGSNIIQTVQSGTAHGSTFFLADSTWASLLSQFGLLGLFLAVRIFYLVWKSPQLVNGEEMIMHHSTNLLHQRIGFLTYFFFASSTIILFEFYAVLPLFLSLLFALRPSILPDANASMYA
ncbi:hypothetical protein [Leptolyngbya sp. FACHB-261]|uniref:hypothetical protein n=1 Tax=Leptolyngbya sp. FACHB-261 TaxID=2692806 RepID=UPI001686240A|nr:hypothetical protein [Leptolyngbya sp. FACHB-261]MBD2099618.1 hypothetical protein [Leptolyngbya sp. FACHB-261]